MQFQYDHSGTRIARSVTSFTNGQPDPVVKTQYYVPSGTDNLAELDDFGRIKRAYTFAGGERIGYKSKRHSALYVKDHLGSTRMTLALFRPTMAGALINHASDTDPYGIIWRDLYSANEETEPHGYTGQEREDDLGLMYYGARYYMPEIGRFLQVDPAREFVNPYSYVGNSPLILIDLTGMFGETIIVSYDTYKREVKPPWRGGGGAAVATGAYLRYLGDTIIAQRVLYAQLVQNIAVLESEMTAAGFSIQKIAGASRGMRNMVKQIIRNEGPLINKYAAVARNLWIYGNSLYKPVLWEQLTDKDARAAIESAKRYNRTFGKLGGPLKMVGNALLLAEIALSDSPKQGEYPLGFVFDPHYVDGVADETEYFLTNFLLYLGRDVSYKIGDDEVIIQGDKDD